MNLKKIAVYLIAGFLGASLFACSGAQVTRVDPSEEIDLSGNWNDTDSRQVSEAMISEALGRPWVEVFVAQHGKKPRIIVGQVLNKTEEHITTETFIKDLEIALIDSGKAVMVASSEQRTEIRDEREDQAIHARPDTAKAPGQETGADFMIKGQINSIFDQKCGAEVKYYEIELVLIDLANNEKVWIGQKQIKKGVARKIYKV